MASRFVLTAQLQLQAPTNTRQIINDLRSELSGIKIPIEVQGAAQATKEVDKLIKTTRDAGTAAEQMGKSFGLAFKRFAAFTVASRTVSLFTNSLAQSIDEAIDFQREMVKLAQVTQDSDESLAKLENRIFDLSSAWGVASKDLVNVTLILAQAGIKAKDLDVALSALAKTALSPTFDDITETTEGVVAILAQFKEGVGALERQLGAINRVSADFAVESSDLIEAVRRFGGVFKASGGSLEELISLFTSVRATTRESAESISTGLRTIFTRIQRPKTIEFLKQFGVELESLDGKFVGPYEAVRQLSKALGGLEEGDIQFIRIAEELGGFRQIGKVIPLLREFETAERARQSAIAGGDSLTQDAIKAQQALAVQFTKVREEFQKLIQGITNTTTFQTFAKTSLSLASAFIKIAESVKPLIPLLATIAAFKFAQGVGNFASGFGSAVRGLQSFDPAKKKHSGGRIHAFARGGVVPGTGNRDTVPAMLTPGEFVIRKSSVQKIGADKLAAMNENKYNDGTKGTGVPKQAQGTFTVTKSFAKEMQGKGKNPITFDESKKKFYQQNFPGKNPYKFSVKEGEIGGFILQPAKGKDAGYSGGDTIFSISAKDKIYQDLIDNNLQNQPSIIYGELQNAKYPVFYPGGKDLDKTSGFFSKIQEAAQNALQAAADEATKTAGDVVKLAPIKQDPQVLKQRMQSFAEDNKAALETIQGYVFESVISGLTGEEAAGSQANFDFTLSSNKDNRNKLAQLFGNDAVNKLKVGEAKRSYDQFASPDGILRKTANQIRSTRASELDKIGIQQAANGGIIQKFAKGTSGKGVPLVDDILQNAPRSAILPTPSKAIQSIIDAGGATLDVDRTLIRTVGDTAYAKAKTPAAKDEVLARYFRDPVARMRDITTSPITQFGQELIKAVASGIINPKTLGIISKSSAVPGIKRYLRGKFGIPESNMQFTSGGDKVPYLEAFNKQGSKIGRMKKFAAGGAAPSDTVPALLTPGEFVINKQSAQRIGYGNLNRMNKHGVTGFARGGSVGIQRFDNGGGVPKPGNFTSLDELVKFAEATKKSTKTIDDLSKSNKDILQAQEVQFTKLIAVNTAAATVSTVLKGFADSGDKAQTGIQKLADVSANLITQVVAITSILPTLATGFKNFATNLKTTSLEAGIALRDRGTARIKGAESRLLPGGSIAGKLEKSLGNSVIRAGSFISNFADKASGAAVAITAVTGVTYALGSAMDDLRGVHERAKKAIEEGNVAVAGKAAIDSKLASDSTTLSAGFAGLGAAAVAIGVTLFGMTLPISATIVAITALIVTIGKFSGAFDYLSGVFRDTVGQAFGMDSTEMIKLKAEADATAAYATKELAKNSELASQKLKDIAEGRTTARSGFELGGEFARSIQLELDKLNTQEIVRKGNTNKDLGMSYEQKIAQLNQQLKRPSKVLEAARKREPVTALVDETNLRGLPTGQKTETTIQPGNPLYQRVVDEAQRDFETIQKQIVDAQKKEIPALAEYQRGILKLFTSQEDAFKALTREYVLAGKDINNFYEILSQDKGLSTTITATASNIQKRREELKKELLDPKLIGGDIMSGTDKPLFKENNGVVGYNKDLTPLEQQQATKDLSRSYDKNIEALLLELQAIEGFAKNLINTGKAMQDNIDYIESLNFGLRNVTSAANAASLKLETIKNQDFGFNSFENSLKVLEAAVTSTGANISDAQLGVALKDLETSLQTFGASTESVNKTIGSIKNIRDIQAKATPTLEQAQKSLTESATTGNAPAPQRILDTFRKEITGQIQDVKLKELFDNALEKLATDETLASDIKSGNVNALLKAFDDIVKVINEDALSSLKQYSEINNELINITKKRKQIEEDYIEAQQKAIDLQIEAAKYIEELGGKKLTPQTKLAAKIDQINLLLKSARVGTLNNTDPNNLRNAFKEIKNSFELQQKQVNENIRANALGGSSPNQISGAAGAEKDNREKLLKVNEQLINFTKDRIELIKEELDLVNKKNQAEKESLDKLLSGDIEGFLQQQQAVSAAAVLQTGDQSLTSAFSASALAPGFKVLEEQGVAGVKLEKAASLLLQKFGISDQRSAQVLSRNTTEANVLRQQGTELSEILGKEAATALSNLSEIKLNSANVEIQSIQNLILLPTQTVNNTKETLDQLGESAEKTSNQSKKTGEQAEELGVSLEKTGNKSDDTGNKIQSLGESSQDTTINISDLGLSSEEAAINISELALYSSLAKDEISDLGLSSEGAATKVSDLGTSAQNTITNINSTSSSLQSLIVKINETAQALSTISINKQNNTGSKPLSTGGLIYANNGMFVPRGTDTVPAMLTPGEFVVNAKSTRKNIGLLESINKGGKINFSKGGIVYADNGGYIGYTDLPGGYRDINTELIYSQMTKAKIPQKDIDKYVIRLINKETNIPLYQAIEYWQKNNLNKNSGTYSGRYGLGGVDFGINPKTGNRVTASVRPQGTMLEYDEPVTVHPPMTDEARKAALEKAKNAPPTYRIRTKKEREADFEAKKAEAAAKLEKNLAEAPTKPKIQTPIFETKQSKTDSQTNAPRVAPPPITTPKIQQIITDSQTNAPRAAPPPITTPKIQQPILEFKQFKEFKEQDISKGLSDEEKIILNKMRDAGIPDDKILRYIDNLRNNWNKARSYNVDQAIDYYNKKYKNKPATSIQSTPIPPISVSPKDTSKPVVPTSKFEEPKYEGFIPTDRKSFEQLFSQANTSVIAIMKEYASSQEMAEKLEQNKNTLLKISTIKRIQSQTMDGAKLLGQYDTRSNTMNIPTDFNMKDIETVMHELSHAFQNKSVKKDDKDFYQTNQALMTKLKKFVNSYDNIANNLNFKYETSTFLSKPWEAFAELISVARNPEFKKDENAVDLLKEFMKIYGYNKGGLVYASRGTFIPKGTDTVPAMLTPGEFVVKAQAAKNNLGLLQSINNGNFNGSAVYAQAGGSIANPNILMRQSDINRQQAKEVVGSLSRDLRRSVVSENPRNNNISNNIFDPSKNKDISDFEDSVTKFSDNISIFKKSTDSFKESVDKLMNFQLSVKLDPTNVTVNFAGTSFLGSLKEDIKRDLLKEVSEKIKNGSFDEAGRFNTNK